MNNLLPKYSLINQIYNKQLQGVFFYNNLQIMNHNQKKEKEAHTDPIINKRTTLVINSP